MPASLTQQGRPLTEAERTIARSVFGEALDLEAVRIFRRKWWWFQPANVTMAPRGHVHFHPCGMDYRACFAGAGLGLQGHLIHELVHVWQHQQGVCLPLRRHPFCRYVYEVKPGKAFADYGLEQQAEMVRHVFLARRGVVAPGAGALAELEALLPFAG